MDALNFLKKCFKHIVVFDYEYKQDLGDHPKPVCCTFKDLVTGEKKVQWFIDSEVPEPCLPYPVEQTLFIGHWIPAEAACILELGEQLPKNWYDTFVEEKKFYNGLSNNGYSLVNSCKRYGIQTISNELKEQKRNLIINNYPHYTQEEKEEILEYNLSDVEINEQLFLAHLKKIDEQLLDPRGGVSYKEHFSQAVFHSRAMALCAKIERNGIPINLKLHHDLEENYEDVRIMEMDHINKECGVELYVDYKLKQSQFEQLLKNENLYDSWPKTPTGKCSTSDKTLYRFQNVNEKILKFRNAKIIVESKKLKGLCMGPDGRSRTPLKMFDQITGRTNLSTKYNPFGAPRRMRNLIGTDKDHILVYADWKSQEAVIQAALSEDPKMIAAVKSGDPYLFTAKQVGAVPADAIRKDYEKERELYKQSFLALAYMQSPIGLNAKLENTMSEAFYIHEQITNLYSKYFEWINGVIREALLRGYFKTKYGWKYHLTSNEKVNPRRLANWPLQSHGSEILRRAMIDLDEAGFEISLTVHDAVLIHMPIKNSEARIKELKNIMSAAANTVIGWQIPVDIKIIRDQFYQDKDNQKLWDDLYSKILKAKQRVTKTDSVSAFITGPSENQTTVYSN